MKQIRLLFIFTIFLSLLASCAANDSYLKEEDVRAQISKDLSGKVWKATRYTEIIKYDNGETKDYIDLDLNQAPIKEITFSDKILIFGGTYAGNMSYDVTSIVYGLEVAPDPHILTVRTDFAENFTMYLKKDYTYFSAQFTLKSNNKTYAIDFAK